MKLLIITLILMACAGEQRAAEPFAPQCLANTAECSDLWYAYGDVTGDYGVVDFVN